jgi:hypothetical protein
MVTGENVNRKRSDETGPTMRAPGWRDGVVPASEHRRGDLHPGGRDRWPGLGEGEIGPHQRPHKPHHPPVSEHLRGGVGDQGQVAGELVIRQPVDGREQQRHVRRPAPGKQYPVRRGTSTSC